MPGELSKILEHVEKMDELDLEGVEPTTHVVELQNVLREDVPRPSLPRERALARRARRGRRRLPGAQPGRLVSDLLGLTAAQQAELIALRRGLGRRGVRVLARAAPPATTSAPTCGWPRRRPPEPGRAAAGGRQGPVLRRGRAELGRLAHPRGLPAGLHRHQRAQPAGGRRARCSARPTRTSSRWARRTRTPASARCRTPGTAAACRAAPAAAAPPRWRPAGRPGRSAPTPAARSASPPRCAASSGSSPPTARSAATG